VECPKCGHVYEDLFRGSVNLDLDPFGEEHLDQCSSATCPECQHKLNFDIGTNQSKKGLNGTTRQNFINFTEGKWSAVKNSNLQPTD